MRRARSPFLPPCCRLCSTSRIHRLIIPVPSSSSVSPSSPSSVAPFVVALVAFAVPSASKLITFDNTKPRLDNQGAILRAVGDQRADVYPYP